MAITFDLVSMAAVLRDYISPAYINQDHKNLTDIADYLYNVGGPVDSLLPEYKELYDKYSKTFFDKVLADMSAIDSQVYNDSKVQELISDYNDRSVVV